MGALGKLKNWVGLVAEAHRNANDEEEFYDELFGAADEYEEEEEILEEKEQQKRSGLKVVSPIKSGAYEVMVSEPKTFEESLEVVNSLRDRKSIILNLHLLDAEQSQRVVDFVSGATHAVDGHQQRIGEGVFIFTPNNVAISTETEQARILQEAYWNQA